MLPAMFALRSGWLILMISGLCCFAPISFAQTSGSTTTDPSNNFWTATTESNSGDLLPTCIPVRVIESHNENGNRTIKKRSIQIQGGDGQLAPYQEIETETLQVDASTVRTTIRTFGQDVNGVRSLIQLTEEEKHTLPTGASTVVRNTFNPDVNGELQAVQREMVETKMIGEAAEETNTTVMLPNINGGLAPAFKTHELRKRRTDGTTESQKSTLLADGAGKWELGETRQITGIQEGAKRTLDERIFLHDADGRLSEVSRVVTKELEEASGERKEVTETYSVDVPGATRDGNLHLVERATTAKHISINGEQVTEKKVEQPDPGDADADLRVSILVNDQIVRGPSGEQSSVTIRALDSNGSFGIVAVDTTRSDRIPIIQIQHTPAEQSK